MKIAFLFPGQGAQQVGMGKDLYEKYEEVRDVFEKASEISGIDIPTLCFLGIRKKYDGSEFQELDEIGDDLNKTENTQLAIATLSFAILRILEKNNIKAQMAAGLSLGEYTALMYSGYLSFEDGIKLLKTRGHLMQNKIPEKEYLMAAVIGLDSGVIEGVCKKLNDENMMVFPANYNYSNQTVISGEKDAVKKAIEYLKEKGAKRVVELKTSGPFHTRFLEEAKDEYEEYLKDVNFKEGKVKVIKNIDGIVYNSSDDIKQILAKHIVSPVRFDKTIKTMIDNGIDMFVEIGCGKVLTGFVKKENKTAKVINIFDVESLEKALEILKEGEE